MVNVTIKEPVHRIVDRIKNEENFRWPNKMEGDPSWRNQNLYCTYHKDKGAYHQAMPGVKGPFRAIGESKISEGVCNGLREQGCWLRSTVVAGKRAVLTIAPIGNCSDEQPTKKKMKIGREPITFNDDDLEGTIQPYDDAVVVTVRINGFIVKRVMIDQENGADVMYPDLFRRLELKKEDFSKYDMPLVGFDGQDVIPDG
nr:uncharacterized protein LOC112001068 [Quercus suber]